MFCDDYNVFSGCAQACGRGQFVNQRLQPLVSPRFTAVLTAICWRAPYLNGSSAARAVFGQRLDGTHWRAVFGQLLDGSCWRAVFGQLLNGSRWRAVPARAVPDAGPGGGSFAAATSGAA